MSHRIVITRPLPGDPVGWLREAGFTDTWIFPEDRKMTRQELLDAVPGTHAVLNS